MSLKVFSFKPVVENDVVKALCRIHTNAMSCDRISTFIIKTVQLVILPIITYIFYKPL